MQRERTGCTKQGGLSRVLAAAFDEFFFNAAGGVDFAGAGIALRLGGTIILLRAIIGVFIGDEPALKDMFCSKGHQGVRSCICCRNIIQARYMTPARAKGNVPSTCVQFDRFLQHTDESVRLCIETVAQHKACRAAITNIELGARACAFRPNKKTQGSIWHGRLRWGRRVRRDRKTTWLHL